MEHGYNPAREEQQKRLAFLQEQIKEDRLREIFGAGYNEAKMDSIIAVRGTNVVEEVNRIAEIADPEEKNRAIAEWYDMKENKDCIDLFRGEGPPVIFLDAKIVLGEVYGREKIARVQQRFGIDIFKQKDLERINKIQDPEERKEAIKTLYENL